MKLATMEWGDGARTAVLVHGITSNAAGWVNVAPTLVEWGYKVIAVDLRGHGKSPKPATGYSPRDLAADLADTVPHEPDLLLGHSLGGITSLVATAEGMLRPRRLVLEDPAVLVAADAIKAHVAASEAMPRDVESLLAQNPRWTRADAEAKAEAFADLSWDAIHAIAATAPWDERASYSKLACPSLLILADPSTLVPPDDAREAEAILGPGSVVTIENATHNIHREFLPEFLAALRAWLDRVGM